MTSQELDIKTEELLKALGTELGIYRLRYADSILDEAQSNPPFFINEIKKHTHKKLWKKSLVLVAALILAMALALATATGAMEKLFNYIFIEHDGYTEVMPSDSTVSTSDGELPNFQLTVIPSGYTLLEEDSFAGVYSAIYENGNEDYMYFNGMESQDYVANFDNDTLKRKEILLGEYQAYMFYDETTTIIVWQVGKYTMDLHTVLGEEATIEIARNIFIE